jgi:hypothetical protein
MDHHNPDHALSEAAVASRAWMATLEELGAMPANAFAEALVACPASQPHPPSHPRADEDQIRLGMEKLASVI